LLSSYSSCNLTVSYAGRSSTLHHPLKMVRASKVFTILALLCASASAAADCANKAEDETSLLQQTSAVNRRTQPEQFPEDIIEESESQGPAMDAFDANKAKAPPPMVAEESQREAFEDTVHDEREANMQGAEDRIAADRSQLEANAQRNKERIDGALDIHGQTVQAAIAEVKRAKHEYADTKHHEAFVKSAAIAGLRQGENDGIAAVGQLKQQDDRNDLNREIGEHRAAAAEAHEEHIQGNMDAVNAATARQADDLDDAMQQSADITSGAIDSSDDRTGDAEEDIARVDPFVAESGETAAGG